MQGTDGATRLNIERMKKYSLLIGEYADSQAEREVACLFGIQQLIHRLEHPQGKGSIETSYGSSILISYQFSYALQTSRFGSENPSNF